MHSRLVLAVFLSALVFAGCSTPDSRIQKNVAAFSSYSPEVQARIRAGEVDVGFTPEMVQMAFGKPDRVFRRQTEDGESESWSYHDKAPVIGFSVGVGGGGRHSGGGVAVGGTTGGDQGERLRVHFQDGKVAAVDRFQR